MTLYGDYISEYQRESNYGLLVYYAIVFGLGFFGNGVFLLTLKKNPILHITPYFFLASLALCDILVSILVIPFLMDSQAIHGMEWTSGEASCKFFSFINYGTMTIHSFNLVFLIGFLFLWYRKPIEESSPLPKKTKLHKWAIPLLWILGLGVAVPVSAVALDSYSQSGRTCAIWSNTGRSSEYWIQLSSSVTSFLVPLLMMICPLFGSFLQLIGVRSPSLSSPHFRIVLTGIISFVIWIATRLPSEIYILIQLTNRPMNEAVWGRARFSRSVDIQLEMILTSLIYLAPALNPFLYFILNPSLRVGFRELKNICQRSQRLSESNGLANKRQYNKAPRQYPSRNRLPSKMRAGEESLVNVRQPIIMSASERNNGMSFSEHQKMLQIAEQIQFLDTSYDRQSPMLPPVFEYDGLKYIDTARVQPKIAYSPEQTPPKTPDTPRYEQKPFMDPVQQFIQNNQWHSSTMFNVEPIEMIDLSPTRDDNFYVEQLDTSPGRSRHRGNNERQNSEFSHPETIHHNGVEGNGNNSSARTRSRQDLCPDVPRSKYEHSV